MCRSRRRLLQQLLTESVLLAVAGGIAGVAIARWTAHLVRGLLPTLPVPVVTDAAMSLPVLAFTTAVAAVGAIVFGFVPALHATSSSVLSALKSSAASLSPSRGYAGLRQALVMAQVAASLILLVSASLFVRTLKNAQAVDPGFSMRRGLLASIDLTSDRYDAARGRAFYRELLARARALRGVEAVSLASRVPLLFWSVSDLRVQIDGYTPSPNEEVVVDTNRVGSDYFRTMGIALIDGREFTERDTPEMPDVGIVNETLARRYFGGGNPVGGRIRIGSRTIQIVGVARDGKYTRITESPRPFLYLPFHQWYRPEAVLHLKTAGNPAALVSAVHQIVRDLNSNVPLFDVRTMSEHLLIATFLQRQIADMLTAFGALALLLAVVGLYGVVATSVGQRTSEIGMRMALGADRSDIVVMILKQGLGMTMLGVATGLTGEAAAGRVFKSLLVGVSATDVVSFVGTTALLLLVAAAAIYVPARRAASISPLEALRQE